jgi:polyisoprenyl-phosphate glycosyltransferase
MRPQLVPVSPPPRRNPSAQRDPQQALLSIILPAFNEEAGLAHTIRAITDWLKARQLRWEILVVDDGSRDRTVEVARQLPASMQVRVVRLSRNFGKEAALTAGLDLAQGDVVVCMDSDGQHPIDMVAAMLDHWREGMDMVYTVRADRHTEARFKRVGSKWFYRMLSWGTQVHIPPDAGDFRLMDRCVVDALKALPERSRFMKGLYAWVGFRTVALPYTPLERQHGVSTYSKRKLMRLAWTGFTGFSSLPLRLSSAFGLLLAISAMLYAIYVVADYLLFNNAVPGWPTIVVSIMFFSGVQLLFIGVLGEYLARVYDEVKGRPNYLVADVSTPPDDEPA